jgi:hypothetical protein
MGLVVGARGRIADKIILISSCFTPMINEEDL